MLWLGCGHLGGPSSPPAPTQTQLQNTFVPLGKWVCRRERLCCTEFSGTNRGRVDRVPSYPLCLLLQSGTFTEFLPHRLWAKRVIMTPFREEDTPSQNLASVPAGSIFQGNGAHYLPEHAEEKASVSRFGALAHCSPGPSVGTSSSCSPPGRVLDPKAPD